MEHYDEEDLKFALAVSIIRQKKKNLEIIVDDARVEGLKTSSNTKELTPKPMMFKELSLFRKAWTLKHLSAMDNIGRALSIRELREAMRDCITHVNNVLSHDESEFWDNFQHFYFGCCKAFLQGMLVLPEFTSEVEGSLKESIANVVSRIMNLSDITFRKEGYIQYELAQFLQTVSAWNVNLTMKTLHSCLMEISSLCKALKNKEETMLSARRRVSNVYYLFDTVEKVLIRCMQLTDFVLDERFVSWVREFDDIFSNGQQLFELPPLITSFLFRLASILRQFQSVE